MRLKTRLERIEQQAGNELAPEGMVELIRRLKTEKGLESETPFRITKSEALGLLVELLPG
ncbi:hypothetical protein [Geoalkalibacter subterraneus]|jgi:hypothetical protein|uniref:Uncharacterized protein n=1 Tax=Geoalkalibacter subterraneus TaxID=483547 RepID=A0A0B5FUE0_9BACT|nr:hypothetical protein [Geoalkalibacter subterraneus]AJF07795.1 hypothetical protein GSUB_16255 [Geoalkalibacter subterraneus]